MTVQSQAATPETGSPFIAEVADMLFATKTLEKIGKGQGTWGDLALVGVTAASFTVLPTKLVMLSGGALMKVIKASSKVVASEKASVAAKRAAAKTLEDALTIKRQGRNTAMQSMSEARFKNITSPEPERKFVPEGPPLDKYNPRNQGQTRPIDEDYDPFNRDRNPAQEADDYIALQGIFPKGPKRNLTKEELEAEEKLKEILSSGMYDKIKYSPDEIDNLIAKLTPEEKVLLKGATKEQVKDYVRTGAYERIPVPGAGRRAKNTDVLRRIHSGNYTDDEIFQATEALQKWNKDKIKADTEEITGLYLSIRRLLKDEKLKKGTVPPDILKYLKTHFPDIKKEFKDKVVATAEGKAILKTYEKEHPLQKFVEKAQFDKDGNIIAQPGDLRPTDSFIRYEETVDDVGNPTGRYKAVDENPTVLLNDDIVDMTRPILKGPTRVRKTFPTVRIENVPEVIFRTTDNEDVRRASALFAEREKLNIFNKSNSKNMRKADEEEIQRLKQSSARNNKIIDKLAVEIKDIGTRLTREEKIRVQELAEIIKQRQLLVRDLTFNPKNKMSEIYKGSGIYNFQKVNKQGREELNPSGFVQKRLDEFDENIKRKNELQETIDELETTVKNEEDYFMGEYYSRNSPPIESLSPQELKFMQREEDRINALRKELQDKINPLRKELEEIKTKPKATKPKVAEPKESKVNSLIDKLKTTESTGSVIKWKDKTDKTVYIGRVPSDPTGRGRFGNPFEVGKDPDYFTVEQAVAKYNKWLRNKIETDSNYANEIYALKGKELGCPGKEPVSQCHGQAIQKAIKYLDENPQYLGNASKATKSTVSALKPIDSFRGTNQFLSNMSSSPVKLGEVTYPTVEHAFQAAKTTDPTERAKILAAKTAAEAKKIGKTVTLRKNWNQMREEVMEKALRAKFEQNPELKKKLIDTGDVDLIESNTWGDTFWGQVNGKGENKLGKLLMKIRKELMEGK